MGQHAMMEQWEDSTAIQRSCSNIGSQGEDRHHRVLLSDPAWNVVFTGESVCVCVCLFVRERMRDASVFFLVFAYGKDIMYCRRGLKYILYIIAKGLKYRVLQQCVCILSSF